jgi:murE/murF fusion protein
MARLVGTRFNVAAFSNLSQDHLDIHNTMEEYQGAKALLFRNHLKDNGVAVINIDDPAGQFMIDACPEGIQVLRVSRTQSAEVEVQSYTSSIRGLQATIRTPRGQLEVQCDALIGDYNIENIALAVGIAEAMQLPHKAIVAGLRDMRGVPGRVERVANNQGLNIFVDYAHTPDALENVLSALRPLTEHRLICVFGCGGDRDQGKRPQMGRAVAQAADLAIVTSDNPRTEDPQAILDMITPEVPNAFFVDVDRRIAIQAAIGEATPADVVLIAGKGHEDYQVLGTTKVHFDDREEAANACELRPSFSLQDILSCLDGELVSEGANTFSRVIIDGRIAAPGDLYVAIQGERFDGHAFCQQAIDAGASGIIRLPNKGQRFEGITTIEVQDTRVALGDIARMHRQEWQGKVIGITGSAGKTTTKELSAAALRSSGRVHAALGSNNNETGVPLTLLGLRPYHDFAVVEMGMRALGEIDYLAGIALPNVCVVVNAGTAHIGLLGSTAAIARAKGEIFGNHFGPGTAIYPADDPRLADLARAADHQLSFGGADTKADLKLLSYEGRGELGAHLQVEYKAQTYSINIPLLGQHNAINACCALLAAIAAGADPAQAAQSIEGVRAPKMRAEVREIAGRKVLMDCYNANPASMQAALSTLSEMQSQGKVFAVLGDMLELGSQSAECHKRVGEQAAALNIPVLAMGEFRNDMVNGAAGSGGIAWSSSDPRAAARAALACTQEGDWILLKASRGMKLETVADSILEEGSK